MRHDLRCPQAFVEDFVYARAVVKFLEAIARRRFITRTVGLDNRLQSLVNRFTKIPFASAEREMGIFFQDSVNIGTILKQGILDMILL